MKLLMIYAERFAYETNQKNLESAPDMEESRVITNAILACIHSEAEDEEQEKKVREKLVKNIKWLAGKLKTKRVILHSFAHLSESKASPEFTKALFDAVQAKLENAEYEVWQTPFGYFLNLELQAPGFSLARVFKSL